MSLLRTYLDAHPNSGQLEAVVEVLCTAVDPDGGSEDSSRLATYLAANPTSGPIEAAIEVLTTALSA